MYQSVKYILNWVLIIIFYFRMLDGDLLRDKLWQFSSTMYNMAE